ncbi:MAG TPA: hypothetical protein VJ571_01070 [Candidatus Nitrosotalea sp.]|nr:hypothetical protein [Candidatus Nitrosotalea sp.]
MPHRIEDFQNDPSWKPSMGERFWNKHFRKGKYHAVCDANTGNCSIHCDEDDPHESVTSLLKHLAKNKVVQGAVATGVITGTALLLDEWLNEGKGRKAVKKTLFG